ncbi:MAG TPA: sugar ABC transporter substrate-binding protein [Chloroflexota bacterium]|nr:sugar ABC transporter substrate-binding protein [Chloroflexota bacterium]
MTKLASRRTFLLAGSAILLAACGGPPAAPTAAPAVSGSAGGTQPNAAQAPAGGGAKVKLRRAFWGSPDQIDIAKQTDKRFLDANPDIEMDFIAIPWENYRDKLITMIAGGDVPDIMGVDAYWVLNFVERKMLRPLDDKVQADKEYASVKVIKGMFPIPDHHAVAGKTYSNVTVESPRILFYNETMFKDAGIPTPYEQDKAGKWDWNAYLDTAKKLTKGSGADKVFGTGSYPLSNSVYPFIQSNGADTMNKEKTKATLQSAELLEAVQFQIDLIKVHKVAPLPEENQALGGDYKAFQAKKLAMLVTGIWGGADFRNIKDFDWAIAPIPKSPRTGYRRTVYKPNATALPAGSKSVDQAWRYLSFDPLGQNKSNIDKYTSMTAFEDNKQYFLEKSPVKNARVVFDAFENNEISYVPLTTKWLEMEKILNDEITLARNGEKSLADAMKTAEPKINALFGG